MCMTDEDLIGDVQSADYRTIETLELARRYRQAVQLIADLTTERDRARDAYHEEIDRRKPIESLTERIASLETKIDALLANRDR